MEALSNAKKLFEGLNKSTNTNCTDFIGLAFISNLFILTVGAYFDEMTSAPTSQMYFRV